MDKIIRIHEGDILELKKPHPCGSSRFTVMRSGSDVRVICLGCSRDMTVPRIKLEKSIKKIEHAESGKAKGTVQ